MSNSLRIICKSTGELFDVPFGPDTTVYDLIKYVCTKSISPSKASLEDYYLANNDSDMLDKTLTVNEAGLDRPGGCNSLKVCLKTKVLLQRILQNQRQILATPNNRVPQGPRQITTTQPGNVPSPVIQQQVTTASSISTERDAASVSSDVHFLICGAPKVGKSTLINALCGSPVAKVSDTLAFDQCTRTTNCYKIDNIYFWDTPGIQEWSRLDIDSYVKSTALHQPPLCMFYCASPGSFAKLQQLDMLLDECIRRRHIFCALVVTNMFSNTNRNAVLNEFKTLLSKYVDPNRDIREDEGVWYYGQVGLCTIVNSKEYVNEDAGRRQPQKGVNELILGVTKSLSTHPKLHGWLRTIKKNQKFWIDKQRELYDLGQLTT